MRLAVILFFECCLVVGQSSEKLNGHSALNLLLISFTAPKCQIGPFFSPVQTNNPSFQSRAVNERRRFCTRKQANSGCESSPLLPGVPGPCPAPPLPVQVPSRLRGPPGLPASAVRHCRRRAQADRPGRRQRRGDGVPLERRLHHPVSQPQLQPAVLGPRRVRGPEREEEHLQRLQVRPLPPVPDGFMV